LDIDSPDERQKRLDEAEEAAMAGVKEMRELCNNLTPPWLDLGLAQALTELAENQSERLGLKISLDLEELPELPEDITLAFFRITQEAVNNAARHAEASNVKITLRNTGKAAVLEIVDDGKGFQIPEDIASLRVAGHRGLSNMKERMSIIGGKLSISSLPGKGTGIRCELPFENIQ